MARRKNYGFEKRQNEIKRQKKKDAKLEKKRLKKEGVVEGSDEEQGEDATAPDGSALDSDQVYHG